MIEWFGAKVMPAIRVFQVCLHQFFIYLPHVHVTCDFRVFFWYTLFASFHRQYVYHDLTVCVFVKHAKPLQIFCRNTILVSLNHTNNVFESIIKT